MKITMDLTELQQLEQYWDSPDIIGPPMHNFFDAVGVHVMATARPAAPHDRGRLRGSINHKIDDAVVPGWVKVGSNLEYAPYMEYGTGIFAEGKGAKGGRHWPPGDALNVWAKRHGWASGADVAAIIGLRGGLKPRRYLRNALADSLGQVAIEMAYLAREVVNKMAGKV